MKIKTIFIGANLENGVALRRKIYLTRVKNITIEAILNVKKMKSGTFLNIGNKTNNVRRAVANHAINSKIQDRRIAFDFIEKQKYNIVFKKRINSLS